jgi:hypothetical protein
MIEQDSFAALHESGIGPEAEVFECPLLRRCWGDKRTSNTLHPSALIYEYTS